MKSQDVYGEPTILKYPGMTVRVYRPILTDEERARRMKRIEQSAAALLIEYYKRKEKDAAVNNAYNYGQREEKRLPNLL